MKVKYDRKETLTGLVTVIGLLSIPAIVVKDRIKAIKAQEKEKKAMKEIVKYTMELEENLTNKNVIQYIQSMKNIDIPNKIMCKNIIIEAYKLVKDNKDINDDLKADLRMLLECKGVSFVY